MEIKAGDRVCVLIDYRMCPAIALEVNKRSITVALPEHAIPGHIAHERKPDISKVVHENEMCAPVWETWKGKNGRGGYRIDKELYVSDHKPAKDWVRVNAFYFVRESAYGVI